MKVICKGVLETGKCPFNERCPHGERHTYQERCNDHLSILKLCKCIPISFEMKMKEAIEKGERENE